MSEQRGRGACSARRAIESVPTAPRDSPCRPLPLLTPPPPPPPKMPRLSLAPLRAALRTATPRATRSAAPASAVASLRAFHLSARRFAPDAPSTADAPSIGTSAAGSVDAFTGEVIRSADIDVSLLRAGDLDSCPSSSRLAGGRNERRRHAATGSCACRAARSSLRSVWE